MFFCCSGDENSEIFDTTKQDATPVPPQGRQNEDPGSSRNRPGEKEMVSAGSSMNRHNDTDVTDRVSEKKANVTEGYADIEVKEVVTQVLETSIKFG